MATINSGNEWPKSFYDNGGGGLPFVNPKDILSGTLRGDLQVGGPGTVISSSLGQITFGATSGAPIVINAGGISIGGVQVGTSTSTPSPVSFYGPISVGFNSASIYTGDGFPIASLAVGDVILDMWMYTQTAWSGGSGLGGALYLGFNMTAIPNVVATFNSNALATLTSSSTTQTGMTTSQKTYTEAASQPVTYAPNNSASGGGAILPRGPWVILDSSKPLSARAVAPAGVADQFTAGASTVYVAVLHPS